MKKLVISKVEFLSWRFEDTEDKEVLADIVLETMVTNEVINTEEFIISILKDMTGYLPASLIRNREDLGISEGDELQCFSEFEIEFL